MISNIRSHAGIMKNMNIHIAYNGPLWANAIEGFALIVKNRLAFDGLTAVEAKPIFSVVVEQITNMLMYSVEKIPHQVSEGTTENVSVGMFLLGKKGDATYFIQSGNTMDRSKEGLIKGRIDYVNSLDKNGLRKFYKQQMRTKDENQESRGAGLGFIEIAKRGTSPIQYEFEPIDDNHSYLNMYAEIAHFEE
jgi:hypothetical protein